MQQTIGTTRIAHVSDVHMLEARPGRSGAGCRLRHRFVRFGRRLDVDERARRLLDALTAAQQRAATHYVISGDLTELGRAAEFEHLAEVLHRSGIAPARITLVPGNHDAYTEPDAWRRALDGPLSPYAATSATDAGKVVERDDVVLLPLDVSVPQPVTRSAGELTADAAAEIEARLGDAALRRKAIVVVTHHPPYGEGPRLWRWIDSMRGGARLLALLAEHGNVHLLHGHLHRAVTRVIERTGNQVFGAPAVVDAREGTASFRLYDVVRGALVASA
ncbi:MAG: hypothetical protein NVSMB47_09240 [Polyangiales bacterium]